MLSNQVRQYYASLRMFIKTGAGDPLPTVTQIFTSALELFETGTWQKCSDHLMQESDQGRTGSTAKSSHCIDLTRKRSQWERHSRISAEPPPKNQSRKPSLVARQRHHARAKTPHQAMRRVRAAHLVVVRAQDRANQQEQLQYAFYAHN